MKSFDHTICKVSPNGKLYVPMIDIFSVIVTKGQPVRVETNRPTEEERELRFQIISKNPTYKSYYYDLNFIELISVEHR